MSNNAVIALVAGCAGIFSFSAWVGLVLVPAWSSYGRWWERVVATVLSLYVLAALVGLGALAGYGVFDAWRTWSG